MIPFGTIKKAVSLPERDIRSLFKLVIKEQAPSDDTVPVSVFCAETILLADILSQLGFDQSRVLSIVTEFCELLRAYCASLEASLAGYLPGKNTSVPMDFLVVIDNRYVSLHSSPGVFLDLETGKSVVEITKLPLLSFSVNLGSLFLRMLTKISGPGAKPVASAAVAAAPVGAL